ncbi:MAG: hypothetical protein DWQ01_22435 [Planctomycetota bacterium]|nr:MAG: hypothetical protein DWQ01_22435 [Planctomycetota bacterium]
MKPVFILGLLVFATPPTVAQRIGGEWALKHQIFGEQELGFFGDAVAGPGDLDGDGFADFVVGAPYEFFDRGKVYAYSGKLGTLLWEWTEGAVGHTTGSSIAGAGDVNGDGRPDVVVGIVQANKVAILLHDGSLWWIEENPIGNLGGSVAGIGDVNFDGFDDVVVGADRAAPNGISDAGSAIIYSGKDGSLLFRFDGEMAGDRFGLAVSEAGDANLDGFPDLLIGAPWASRAGFSKIGIAYLFSGKNGSLLFKFQGQFIRNGIHGSSLSEIGDLNSDGHDDFMVSAPGADFGGSESGAVFIYSGFDGSLIYRIDGANLGDFLGNSIDSIVDLDRDNIRDLAITSEFFPIDFGRIEIRSGVDGELLDTVYGSVPRVGFGQHIAAVGDIEGNGLDAIITGLRAMSNGNIDSAGAVQVFSPNPFIFADATELSASSGVPVQILMSFPESEANTKYALLLSGAGTGPTTIAGLEVPLGQSLLLSQMLTGWAPFNLHGAFGTLDANAQATATLDSDPTLAGLVGTTFYMAAVTYDSIPALAGRRTSIAWPIRIKL